jgi:hypothetical protein
MDDRGEEVLRQFSVAFLSKEAWFPDCRRSIVRGELRISANKRRSGFIVAIKIQGYACDNICLL